MLLQKNLFAILFVLRSVQRAFLDTHLWLFVAFSVQLKAATKCEGNDTKYTQIKNERRRRNPAISKILILNFLQLFLVIVLY